VYPFSCSYELRKKHQVETENNRFIVSRITFSAPLSLSEMNKVYHLIIVICIISSFLVCCASIGQFTETFEQSDNKTKRFIRIICYDLAQVFYYVVTLVGLTGVNTGIKIKTYSLDTILCILLGLCCLLLSMQSMQTYINGSYKILLECVANLCAFLYIGGNYFAYLDRETIRNSNLIKQSTGRTRYYPPKERPKQKIRK
jgi:hypothetical protein